LNGCVGVAERARVAKRQSLREAVAGSSSQRRPNERDPARPWREARKRSQPNPRPNLDRDDGAGAGEGLGDGWRWSAMARAGLPLRGAWRV
jgi:hypothetical protein